ncbi:WAS/WASL-interacting protein family member 1-like [Dorcoceras hygrometricum]|uniref:WAS/WASL-interacting protein family member 1-like n=1 Tax=Dorcoceras hygrometricum TaxID=472368 RepID=A0A2Z7A961_9LAMI|nr:WAS/WASL-interacting protein family member 1-like [Dorcoceras hygrometricum]
MFKNYCKFMGFQSKKKLKSSLSTNNTQAYPLSIENKIWTAWSTQIGKVNMTYMNNLDFDGQTKSTQIWNTKSDLKRAPLVKCEVFENEIQMTCSNADVDFSRCVLISSCSNADVDFSRWFISAYPAVARDQLLRVISCWYVSCDDLQRALRDWSDDVLMRGRAAIQSHLPDGLVALMRRVVNYHSSWVGQQQVELLMHLVPLGLLCCLPVCGSGFPGYSAGRGFDQAGGAPGGI